MHPSGFCRGDKKPSRSRVRAPPRLPSPSPSNYAGHTRGWSDTPLHCSSLLRYTSQSEGDFMGSSLIDDFCERFQGLDFSDANRRHSINSYEWMCSQAGLLTPPESSVHFPDIKLTLDEWPRDHLIRNSQLLPPIQLEHRRPPPITLYDYPSPASSNNQAELPFSMSEQHPSPHPRHQHHPSGDLRTPLTLTSSNLRMGATFYIMCVEGYLAKQLVGSTDNALDIHASRDILDRGDSLQNTLRNIRCYLHRFSDICISLRNEPDSPNPGAVELYFDDDDDSDDDAIGNVKTIINRGPVDFEDAVNLKSFTWRGSFISLAGVMTGLPKNDLTSLCITDCEISLEDASVLVRSFPNLERLEIDRIDACARTVLLLPPFFHPSFRGPSRIAHLKITSSAPLQGFLEQIKFLNSNTRLKTVELVPYGIRRDILPDTTSLLHRFSNPHLR